MSGPSKEQPLIPPLQHPAACTKDCTGWNRLVKVLDHLTSNCKEPELPQQVQSAQSLSSKQPLHEPSSPVCCLKEHTNVVFLFILQSTNIALVLATLQRRRWFFPHHFIKLPSPLILFVSASPNQKNLKFSKGGRAPNGFKSPGVQNEEVHCGAPVLAGSQPHNLGSVSKCPSQWPRRS